jgi:biotin transport system substrate-specific component
MFAQILSRHYPLWLIRVLRISLFTVLMVISAKIRIQIPGTPVPITMQTMVVLLTGMALGPIEGATTMLAYLGGIAMGMPLDAYNKAALALVGSTAGFLVGFVPGALIAGLGWRLKGQRRFIASLLLGALAMIVIYAFGTLGLLPVFGGSLPAALQAGVVPFVLADFGKILLAASLVLLGRESWLRWIGTRDL